MPTHGLGSATGCTVLSKLLPWSGTPLSSVTSGMNLIITLGQSTAKRFWARILGFSIAFCLLVSTQATLCERDDPFSVPQLPSPLKKRNSSLYEHNALCSVDDSIWAGAKPCSCWSTWFTPSPPRPGCSLTRILLLPGEPYHRASVRRGRKRLQVTYDVGEDTESEVGVMVWTNTEAKISMGLVQISWRCCCRNGAQGFPPLQHRLQDGPSPPGLALTTIIVATVCWVLAVCQASC